MGAGNRIHFRQFDTAYEEAEFVADDISQKQGRKGRVSVRDCAVLYRTNAQSRLLEERFVTAGIPYKIVGGVNFYARREIKDLLAYLKTIDNGRDDLAVQRIINVPKRGIGATTIAKVHDYAQTKMNLSFYDALRHGGTDSGHSARAAAKITTVCQYDSGIQKPSDRITGWKSFCRISLIQRAISDLLQAEG